MLQAPRTGPHVLGLWAFLPLHPTACLIQTPKAVLPGTERPFREKNRVLKSNCRRKGGSVFCKNSQAERKKCQYTAWALTFMPKSKKGGYWGSELGQACLQSLWTRLPLEKAFPPMTRLCTHRDKTDPEGEPGSSSWTSTEGRE